MNGKSIRLQPSLSAQDFAEFKALAADYGWGNVRSDSEVVRLALFEWVEIRRQQRLPIPELIASLGGQTSDPKSSVTSIRLQISLTPEEYDIFRRTALDMGWGRVPEALMARLALMEWCDIRRLSMKRPAEICRQLAGRPK